VPVLGGRVLALHCTVRKLGKNVNCGGVLSITRMRCSALAVLPHGSVNVKFLVITRRVLHSLDTTTMSLYDGAPTDPTHASLANGWPATPMVLVLSVHPNTTDGWYDPTAITGGLESTTEIHCVAVLCKPHASVAVKVRVTNSEPLHAPALVTSTDTTDTAPGQLSTAVAWPCTLESEPHSTVTLLGTDVKLGGMVSTTWIHCTPRTLLPDWSTACHVLVMFIVVLQ